MGCFGEGGWEEFVVEVVGVGCAAEEAAVVEVDVTASAALGAKFDSHRLNGFDRPYGPNGANRFGIYYF